MGSFLTIKEINMTKDDIIKELEKKHENAEEYSYYALESDGYRKGIAEAIELVKKLAIHAASSCIDVGDEVLYVGKYVGVVISKDDVKLRDGTVVKSLRSQPQKFRKII